MTRRIISSVLIALGVVAIVLAIASATVWRPEDRVTLTLPDRPQEPVVVSEAGVLDAVDPQVTIRAEAGPGEEVTLAVGRTADVMAWVGDAPHQRITGLSSWEELAVAAGGSAGQDTEDGAEDAAGEDAAGEGAAVPDPARSDLWVTEQAGAGQVEMEWEHAEGRWSLLAVTDGSAAAPEVSLTWPVESRSPWLVPGIVVGAVLLLAGLALMALAVLSGRESARRRAAAAERSEGRARADAAETDVLTAVGATGSGPVTRRALREQRRTEQGRESGSVRGAAGRAGRTGVVPADGEVEPPSPTPERSTEEWFAGTGAGHGLVDDEHPSARRERPEEGPETQHGAAGSSSLERAATEFAEAAEGQEHAPAGRVDPPHPTVPDEGAPGEGSRRGQRSGLLGLFRRLRGDEEPARTRGGQARGQRSGPAESSMEWGSGWGPGAEPARDQQNGGATGRSTDEDEGEHR